MKLPFLVASTCCVGFALAGEAKAELFPSRHDVSLLSEARWAAPDADLVRLLTESPGECVRPFGNDGGERPAEIGRAAFSSPLLLGGQAARGGLSCASCHVDGRGNKDFFLEGLSAAPGTADVTSSIFSKVRDDGVFNPVPIPSLVGVKGKALFGAHAKAPSLEAFIKGAVADEFAGAAITRPVLEGLVAYIEQMTPEACPIAPQPVTPARAMNDVARTLAAAREAAGRGDAATADFLLVSAQAALGRVHARFPGERSERERAKLLELSSRVSTLRISAVGPVSPARPADGRTLGRDGSPAGGGAGRLSRDIASIERDALKHGKRLEKKKRGSLYDPAAIAAALGECAAC